MMFKKEVLVDHPPFHPHFALLSILFTYPFALLLMPISVNNVVYHGLQIHQMIFWPNTGGKSVSAGKE